MRNAVRRTRRGASTPLGAVAALAAMLCGCSRLYDTPIIAVDDTLNTSRAFPGVVQLADDAAKGGKRLQVLWTHGMCSHSYDWAHDRADRVQTTLGGTYDITPRMPESEHLQSIEAVFRPATNNGDAIDFKTTFILWSFMTKKAKSELDFDKSGNDPKTSFPYGRARLNNSLKVGLLNDCMGDAVAYLGPRGNDIRREMTGAVCAFFGGREDPNSHCDISSVDPAQPFALVAESLGSKFLFDAIDAIWVETGNRPAERVLLAEKLTHINLIYLVSNQIPLLNIGGSLAAVATEAGSGSQLPASSLSEFLGVLREARGMTPVIQRPQDPMVIAFSDPNDLLSYRLLPSLLGNEHAILINVIVSNDAAYFGFLENPLNAHCGYSWNPKVIGLLMRGYEQGRPIPIGRTLPSGACL